jgi:hypothetical protein
MKRIKYVYAGLFMVLCIGLGITVIGCRRGNAQVPVIKKSAPVTSQLPPPADEIKPVAPVMPPMQHMSTDVDKKLKNEEAASAADVDLTLAKLVARSMARQVDESLAKQTSDTQASFDKIIQALDKLAKTQEKLADALESKRVNTAQIVNPKAKYAVQTIDGKWWYTETYDEMKYTEWYYNRRARGVPVGSGLTDKPTPVPGRVKKLVPGPRVRRANGIIDVYEYVTDDTVAAPPPVPGKVEPAPQTYATPQAYAPQTYATPQVYAAPQVAMAPQAMGSGSCYSSSMYLGSTGAYGAQPMMAMAPMGYGYGGMESYAMHEPMRIGGMYEYGGEYGYHGYGDGFGGGTGLNISAYSSRPGLLGRLFGGPPRIRSFNMSLGGGGFNRGLMSPYGYGSGFMGGCPGGVCF